MTGHLIAKAMAPGEFAWPRNQVRARGCRCRPPEERLIDADACALNNAERTLVLVLALPIPLFCREEYLFDSCVGGQSDVRLDNRGIGRQKIVAIHAWSYRIGTACAR